MPRIDSTIDYLNDRTNHVAPLVAVLALMGLERVARLASVGLAALWVADQMRTVDRDRAHFKPHRQADRMIDTAMEDSFPASDPPSYSGSMTSGTPNEPVAPRLRVLQSVH